MSSELPIWAVIPAAGSGTRMGGEVPKQYLAFHGKTILEHCLDRLLAQPSIDGAILVLNEDDRRWEALGYDAGKPLFVALGGHALVRMSVPFGENAAITPSGPDLQPPSAET